METGDLNINGELELGGNGVNDILISSDAESTNDTSLVTPGYLTAHKGGNLTVYNDTGVAMSKGQVVHTVGAVGGVASVELAQSDTFENFNNKVLVLVEDIADGASGLSTDSGIIDGFDTSHVTVGTTVYLSATTAGAFQNGIPDFPAYRLQIGGIEVSNATTGRMVTAIDGHIEDTFSNYYNGTFREGFNAVVTSDGATITMSLDGKNSVDELTMVFSDGFTILDVSTPLTISLTAGTESVPVENYVYIPQSTKVLTKSTTGFPESEHIHIGRFNVQTPALVQSNDALKTHNINDEVADTSTLQGHLTHMASKIRSLGATWKSGAEGSMATDGSYLYASVTAGVCKQMHDQSTTAFDMSTTGFVRVVNNDTTAYDISTDLSSETDDAEGNSLTSTSYSLVLWASANSASQDTTYFVNLPTGSYSRLRPEEAEDDIEGYTVYDIPTVFKETGFLIAKFNIVNNGGTLSIYSTQDLRGLIPNATVGGGGGGGGSGVTTFLALTDTEASYTANALQGANSGGTALENKNVTVTTAGAVSGVTTLDATSTIQIDSATQAVFIADRANNTSAGVTQIRTAGVPDWNIGTSTSGDSDFSIYSYGTVNYPLKIARATGAVTFTDAVSGITTLTTSGLITANGGQIKFPATAVPSSDVNTLDDYESKGDWTGSFTVGTGTITKDVDDGHYTKIGDQVSFTIYLSVASISSPSGVLTVTGLPFTCASGISYHSPVSIQPFGMESGANCITGYVSGGTSTIIINNFSAGAKSDAGALVNTGTVLIISGTYSV